jgi:peptidoglycan hydrolase-like protein with peptidoglycan-binding domain
VNLRILLLLSCVALFAGEVLTAQTSPPPKKSAKTVAKRVTPTGAHSPATARKMPRKTGTPLAAIKKRRAPVKKSNPPIRKSVQLQPTPERYKQIQEALSSRGYFNGAAEGTWGPESVDALKRFQHDQNLTDDGKIGSLSLIALGLGPKRVAAEAPAAEKSDKQVQR